MTDYTSLYNDLDAGATRLNDLSNKLDELSKLIDKHMGVA